MTEKQSLAVYRQKVLPYFDYADILYIDSYQRTLHKLQKQQNRALRICLRRDKRCKTNPLHVDSRVPLLSDRRSSHLCNFMYMRKESQCHKSSSSGRTRLFDAVVMNDEPKVSAQTARSVYVKGAKAWNKIPSGIRNFQTLTQFKHYQKHEMTKKTLNLPIAPT